MSKNLVVITSVTNSYSNSIFTSEQRFGQLLMSIESVKEKIPNCLIVVIEGSEISEEYQKILIEKKGINLYFQNIKNFSKSLGETKLLQSFFSSTLFQELFSKNKFLTISKLSGRYILKEEFVYHYDGETCLFLLKEPENSWSGNGLIETRFYSFPWKYLSQFCEGLEKCFKDIFMDIENSFYKYQVLPLDKHHKIDKIYVGGKLAENGVYIED